VIDYFNLTTADLNSDYGRVPPIECTKDSPIRPSKLRTFTQIT
jgi:hypothetical protein